MRQFKPASLHSLPRHFLISRLSSSYAVIPPPRLRQLSTTRSWRNQQDDPSKIRVSYLNNGYTRKWFMSWALYSAATIILFRFVWSKLEELGDATEEIEEELVNTLVEEEGDAESTFIALQYPKQLPPQFYKQSDPDWQEFISVSKNQERRRDITKELAERVTRDVSKHPQISKVLGKNIKLSKYWLDFKYPDKPPPEYARTGIEITDEYVALATQIVPHSYYIELSHILRPKALFGAAYTSLIVFGRIQMVRVKNFCGIELNQIDKKVQTLSMLCKTRGNVKKIEDDLNTAREKRAKLEQQLKEVDSKASKPPPDAIPSKPSSSTEDASKTSSVWTALKPTNSLSSSDSTPSSYLLSWLPSPPIPKPEHVLQPLTNSSDLSVAWKTFASTLMFNWQRSKMDTTPKGAFYVLGEVEVVGDSARCKADVKAAYDPKEKKFTFVVTRVKNVWANRQTAKGGP